MMQVGGYQAGLGLLFLLIAWPATAGVSGEPVDDCASQTSCRLQLNRLVLYLQEGAALEGALLDVDRRSDGSVLLHYEDRSQRIWCRDGVLHIDCDAAADGARRPGTQ